MKKTITETSIEYEIGKAMHMYARINNQSGPDYDETRVSIGDSDETSDFPELSLDDLKGFAAALQDLIAFTEKQATKK